MKNHRYILSLLLLLVSAFNLMPANAQQNQYAIYNYRNDGDFNAWLNIDVDSITYSCIDMLGVEHDDVVVQEVWTPDSVYRIPISAIDSLGFHAPETEFKTGVFIIDEKHLPYIVDAEDLSITFNLNTPSYLMPSNGQTVYSDLTDDPFYMGFAGRVIEIAKTSIGIKYICEPVSPSEVYDRCLNIYKIITVPTAASNLPEKDNSVKKIAKIGLATDGTITIPDLEWNLDFNLDKFTGGNGNIKIDGKISNSFEYVICVGVIKERDFVNVQHTKKVTYSATTSFKYDSYGDESLKPEPIWTKEPVYSLGSKYFGVSIYPGLFFEAKASLDFLLKLPYSSTQIDNYYFGSDRGWANPWVTSENSGGWSGWEDFLGSIDAKIKLKGSVAFGPVIKCSFQVWKPSFLSFDVRAKGGLELAGECSLDLDDVVQGTWDAYKMVSEDMKITTGLKIGLELVGTAKGKSCTFASASTTLFKREQYLFPRFTQPDLPKYINGKWEGDVNPLSVFTVPSNSLLLPGKVGLGIYDAYGNELQSKYYDSWFFGTGDWQKNWLQTDVSHLEKGKQYVIRPLFRMLNIDQVIGSPSSVLTVPHPVSFEADRISLQVGKSHKVEILGGWGDYSLGHLNKTACDAELKKEGDRYYVQLFGKAKGLAPMTVSDRRSGEAKTLIVDVTEEEVTNLTLSETSVSLQKGDRATVTITSGSGNYTLENSNEEAVSAAIANTNQILMVGQKAGTATITVTDTKTKQTARIIVVVEEESGPTTPTKITITTDMEIGENFEFYIKTELGKRMTFWIDYNNNGINDENDFSEQCVNDVWSGYRAVVPVNTKTFSIYLKNASGLDMLEKKITDIDFREFNDKGYDVKLKELFLDYNKLKKLDVSNLQYLTRLSCDDNELISLDVSNLQYLTRLSCDDNELISLDASGCSALTCLSCSDLQLNSLDVSGCTALEQLYCENNQLTSLDVSGCTALKYLYCENNQLTSLDVSGCSNLEYFGCYNNHLQSLILSNHPKLKELACRDNPQLGSIDLSGLPNLETLNAVYCGLETLNVRNNPKLTALLCDANNLQSLDLSQNQSLACIGINYNDLGVDALNSIYRQVPDLSGQSENNDIWWPLMFKMLRANGNPGYWDSDRSIAEAKGWEFEDKSKYYEEAPAATEKMKSPSDGKRKNPSASGAGRK